MPDIQLDKIILSYFLANKQFALEVSNKIAIDYFAEELQWLYKICYDHFVNPKFKAIPTVDIVREYLKKAQTVEIDIDAKIDTYNELKKLVLDPNEFTWYLNKLKLRYNDNLQKQCVNSIKQVLKESKDDEKRVEDINQIINKTVYDIGTINKRESYKEGSLKDSARERANKYKEIEANPQLARGLFTGFKEFDRATNGLNGGELVIIGGTTSSGKSVLMHNMAVNVYLGGNNPIDYPEDIDTFTSGANVLYFSLEMPKDKQEQRIDACMAGVEMNKIKRGELNSEEKIRYSKVLKFQSKFPRTFYIVDLARGVTAREIEMKHLEQEERLGIKFDLTVIDYMGIMKPSVQQAADWLSLGFISEELHEYARAFNIPVLTATQLNRSKDPTKPYVGTDRVARSDMIPTNANVILQIGSRGEDEASRLDLPVYIIKNRDGEKSSFTLIKNFSCMQVKDMCDTGFGDDDE